MRRLLLCLAVLVTGTSPVLAAGDIVLRTSVVPEEAWVGQRVVLRIDVLGDNGWAQITRFGDVDLAGAYLISTDSQGTRLQETIDGVSYSGQRYELSVYPQVAGSVAVPAIPVEVTTRGWGADAAVRVQHASTPAATISAKTPPGAGNVRGLLSTTRLTAGQEWEPEIEAPKVGDALKRTTTLEAEDVSAMAFTPLEHGDIPGVGVYPGEAEVSDTGNRGSLIGTRIETVTYVFERPGEIRLPDIRLTWWDIGAGELKNVDLPGPQLLVAAGPAGETGMLTRKGSRHTIWHMWPVLAILALALVFTFRYRARIRYQWTAWRITRKESESRYFRRAMRSLKSGDAGAGIRDIMHWLDRINDVNRPARLDLFLRQYGDAPVQVAADQLAGSVASGKKISQGPVLFAGLRVARDRWRLARRARQGRPDGLPELNQ